jgi:hypothetical protein
MTTIKGSGRFESDYHHNEPVRKDDEVSPADSPSDPDKLSDEEVDRLDVIFP